MYIKKVWTFKKKALCWVEKRWKVQQKTNINIQSHVIFVYLKEIQKKKEEKETAKLQHLLAITSKM